MTDKKIMKRIGLSSDTVNTLLEVVNEIRQKGKFYKVNESKLIEVIVLNYLEKYYEKDKEQLQAKFFSKRHYLKEAISSSTNEEELEDLLNKFLDKKKQRKIRRPHSET